MLKSIFDKGIFNSLNFDNAPKLCKEMESQRIDMTALEFVCAVPIIVKCLDLSKKEQMGAIAFASAIVSLNTNEEGKKCLAKPLMEFKNDLLAEFAKTEIPPENTAKAGEPKKNEAAADAAQTETIKSKLPEDLQKLLDDPDVPEKIKKAIMAAADVDADIEIIRVKGKKG